MWHGACLCGNGCAEWHTFQIEATPGGFVIFISIRIALPANRLRSQARLWIEARELCDVTEIEVRLNSNGGGLWTGRIPDGVLGKSGAFLYRLALATAPEATWSLQLIDEDTGCALVDDSDVTDGCKTWLVGTCSRSTSKTESVAPQRAHPRSNVVAMPTSRQAKPSTTSA